MPSAKPPIAKSSDLLASAGAALAGGRWAEARDLYARSLDEQESPDALEGLAFASWWLDDVATAIDARERAYALRRARGDTIEAARTAAFLAWDHGAMRGNNAVASGWLQLAHRLVSDREPSAERAWLALIEASFHLDTDPREVLRLSTVAGEHAAALGAVDIEMTARTLRGLALVSLGDVAAGQRLLDEGTAAATGGELRDPIAIGSCCCNMIIACERARDFDRAAQWCERLEAVCERTGQRPLLALCRAHHGTVMMARGAWDDADADLSWAAGELSTLRPPLARYARARLAQLRARQGRTAEARALLARARGHVLVPLVEAELAFAESDASAALGYAERYLRHLGAANATVFDDDHAAAVFDGTQRAVPPIEGAAALELLVPIHLRLGDERAARDAHADLAAIAGAVRTAHLRAAERRAAARIEAAAGDPDAACRTLQEAIDLLDALPAPYEAAQARSEMARLLAGRDGAGGLTRRELEVLRLVAAGLSNAQIAERLVVSEHTVHRHLANVYAKLRVSSRAAAVAVAAERELLAAR